MTQEPQPPEWDRSASPDAGTPDPEPHSASPPDHDQPESSSPPVREQPAPEPQGVPEPPPGPGSVSSGGPPDPNEIAIDRADLPPQSATWLRQVAAQVDPRLDRIAPAWRESPQAEAARACAFGLLLGRLAALYPHMRRDLDSTAESHPSFSTLAAGSRLETLEQIAGDPSRSAAWLGPLIDAEDPVRIARLTE